MERHVARCVLNSEVARVFNSCIFLESKKDARVGNPCYFCGMNRRTFLKASAVTVATSTIALAASNSNEDKAKGVALVDDPTPAKAEQKLSSQEGRIPGRTIEEKVENLIKFGGVGYELPAQFDPEKVLKAIKGTPVKISAVCAADGPYIVSDKAQRRKAVD